MATRQRLQHIVKGHIQTEPNKWYRLDSPEITECCDCGLVHHTEYMFEKGRMFWRSKVDTKATLGRTRVARHRGDSRPTIPFGSY